MSYCLSVGDCLQINGEDWLVVQTLEDERCIRLTLQSVRPRLDGESGWLMVHKRAEEATR